MSDNQPEPPADLGIYSRLNTNEGIDPTERTALLATVVWIVVCLAFLSLVGLGSGDQLGPLRFLIAFLVVVLPVALIWIATITLKGARVMREESERLQASMDAMRQVYISQAQMSATTMGPNVERKIDEIVKRQRQAESTMASLAAPAVQPVQTRPISVPLPSQPLESQPGLELGTPEGAEVTSVSMADFISAMNFPETTEDRDGFTALKRALNDHRSSRLIRASQDVLTLLSQDGIYMDDLTPERSRPDVWRRFAAGERGPTVSGLGGIRDRSSLALSSARMRQDSIFRDSAHHFLRSFDKTFSQLAENLSDQEIIAIAETRTARAFMLLGRVAGMFT